MTTDKERRKNGLIFLILWVALVIYAFFDSRVFEDSLTVSQALEVSSFARVMFADIGVFSTLAFFWILQSESHARKYFFAIPVLFVGSFALLPFLAIRNLYPKD